MRSILLAILVFVSVACSAPALLAQLPGYNPSKTGDMSALDVSLIQLIANPAAYEGKKVRIIGFLRLEFEGNGLYLHREDYQTGLTKNAIWINKPKDMTKVQAEIVNDRYAICEGVFRSGRHGHMGLFSGEIDQITRLEQWR